MSLGLRRMDAVVDIRVALSLFLLCFLLGALAGGAGIVAVDLYLEKGLHMGPFDVDVPVALFTGFVVGGPPELVNPESPPPIRLLKTSGAVKPRLNE